LDRAEITQIISKVARRGKVIWKDGGAELIVYRSISSGLFLIQAYSEALDQAGRRAPLLCCGEFDGLDNAPKQILEATTAIKNFANEIGRSVDPSHALSFDGPAFRNRLQQWVEGLKKRRATQVGIGLGMAAFATLLTLAVLKQTSQSAHSTRSPQSRLTDEPASQR
jgi:hypothetical protein